MKRAVIFDVDDVLVHGFHAHPERRESWNLLMSQFGMDAEQFQTEFVLDVFFKKVVIGEMSIIEALDRRLPGLGYKGSTMAFAQSWLEYNATPNTELLNAIRALKARDDVRLFLATNQDHLRAQWLWQTLGLCEYFEDMFYSARAGALKPQKAFFDFAEARMGKLEQPPLFFDDSPKVIDGARARGWEAVLFASNADCFRHPWIAQRLG